MEMAYKNLIYKCLAGSHAYGTATPESDVDTRGICLVDREYLIGLKRFEQFESNEEDTVIYALEKFMRLALNANPNILDMLYVDAGDIQFITSAGEKLLANRNMFLSQKVAYSYPGYAYSQLKRIRRHRSWLLNPPTDPPKRTDFGLPDDRSLVSEEDMGYVLWLLRTLIRDSVEESRLSDSTKAELEAFSVTGLLQSHIPEEAWPAIKDLTNFSNEFIQVIRQEKAYRAAKNHWESYQNWKQNRNPRRAADEARFQYDGKHAYALVRLLHMGLEILQGQGVIVKRPDAGFLLSIRNGGMTYNELESYVETKNEEIQHAKKTTTLPKKPDFNRAEELLIDIQHDFLGRGVL